MSTGEQYKELKQLIRKMRKIQKSIAADGQPATRHQLNALQKLGQRYTAIIEQLQSEHSA